MMATTAMHFDSGHALNGFGWVTGIWEVSVHHDNDLAWWLQAVQDDGRIRKCSAKVNSAWNGANTLLTILR